MGGFFLFPPLFPKISMGDLDALRAHAYHDHPSTLALGVLIRRQLGRQHQSEFNLAQASKFLGGLSMKFRPLHDRVLIERVGEAEKTQSGIIIPDAAREKQQKGKIIAVGKGRVNEKGEILKLDVKEGDTVLFEKYGGEDVTIDNKEYVILKEESIIGVVEA
jgi:chaperonin GroES